MNELKSEYRIIKTVDLGTDGMFGPGSEKRFLAKISSLGDEGVRILNRLVVREAVECVPPFPASIPEKVVEDKSDKKVKASEDDSDDQTDKSGDKTDDDENTQDQPDYDATGEFEVNPLGGNTYVISDPKGFIIGEPIKGKKKAETQLEELKK